MDVLFLAKKNKWMSTFYWKIMDVIWVHAYLGRISDKDYYRLEVPNWKIMDIHFLAGKYWMSIFYWKIIEVPS